MEEKSFITFFRAGSGVARQLADVPKPLPITLRTRLTVKP